ncbi:MAG: RNA 2',3'-cyclic phosphodiesterase [Alphaproteobacteria bacterium]|nr:RNA 2',3'-cyclic phosphodiesterase [Alphaproteobacteria bacterium]
MIRLFVALSLPDALAERLAAMAGGVPEARWSEARNLHITLRFIGEVDEAQAADIDAALLGVRAAAFSLGLEGLGTFGGRVAHTLWAGVERVPALFHLQERVEAAMGRAGLVAEGRKYTPHVTLARCKASPPGWVQDFTLHHSPFRVDPFAVDHFHLYQSHLGRSGPDYRRLADYPLDSK